MPISTQIKFASPLTPGRHSRFQVTYSQRSNIDHSKLFRFELDPPKLGIRSGCNGEHQEEEGQGEVDGLSFSNDDRRWRQGSGIGL